MPLRVIANHAIVFAAAWLAAIGGAFAQDVVMEAPDGMDNGAAAIAMSGEGSYFSQDLGTVLRMRYSTESYGQLGRGNFDIGTMPVWTFGTSAAFFDGQVTLNELQGVGYNFGVGFRQLTSPGISRGAGRVAGVSFWTDGTSTDEGNFFPQIGLSLESLGDMWDFRANGYLPLGPDDQRGDFSPTGEIGFLGNSIAELTQAVVNTSYSVAEVEAARRLGSERDAWAFAGPYFVGNDEDDSVGYRLGVRGYAYPDVLLQFAVTDDEIFKTNAAFSVTWFVGRTRTDFQPTCGVPDRLREPVMRNDYVALSRSFVNGGIPLTQPDGSVLRIVHVDSDAGPGGDGTFENPFDQLIDINDTGSLEGDVILAHALSQFTAEPDSILLKDRQRLLGEGRGVEHTVATAENGTLIIPETFPGARDADRPVLLGPAPGSDAIVLANGNEVNNFDIDGNNVTNRAIASPTGGSGNPVLRNLLIRDVLDDGISLTPLAEDDTDDSDNNPTTTTIVRGNVTIADVEFDNVGGDDIDINAFTTEDITLPSVLLQEVISITNVESNANNARSIAIANTHSGAGRVATINNFTYNGGGDSLAGLSLTNFDSTFNASNMTFTGGNITGSGFEVLSDSDGTITLASTVVFNDVTGTAVLIDGTDPLNGNIDALGGTVNINGAITNDTGQSVIVRDVTTGANINFNANITDTGAGILVDGNSGGTITFQTGTIDLDIDTAGADAILLTNNTGTAINFVGAVDIDSTNGADGLIATGGGTLRYSNTANAITTDTGQVVRIENMAVQAANGVVISDINRTAAASTSAVFLEDNTGGPITLGVVADSTPGDSGTLEGGVGVDTVVINNSTNTNVTMSNVIINNRTDGTGVRIGKTNASTQTVNLNDLIINDGDRGINVVGAAGAGALTLTVNDNQILDSTDIGVAFDDVDTGTISFVNTDIDGNNVSATARGVLINRSNAGLGGGTNNAGFSFDVNSSVADFRGTTFQVNETGVANASSGAITFAGDIINNGAGDTSGRSVVVQQVAGGTVNFTSASSIEDNQGILVEDNTGGTISFSGDNNLNTGANTAVTLDDNTGATINFTNLDIDTTTGNGFVATDGGTIAVTGSTNTIDTVDGVALQMERMTIGATGVAFQEINVTDGNTNGIILRDLTGGQVTIGTLGGNASELTTVGDGIVLENVANVDFNNVQVVNATAVASQGVDIDHTAATTTTMDVTFNNLTLTASGAEGIDVDAASTQTFNLRLNNSTLLERVTMDNVGSGAFRVLLNNTDIDITASANTDDALVINFNSGTADGDVTIQGADSDILADGGRALEMSVNGSASVEVLIENTTFDSNAAEDLFLRNNVGAKTDATIRNNTFDAGGAATDVQIQSIGGPGFGTRLDLNLFGNGPDNNTDIELFTNEDAVAPSNFGVVDLPNVDANNAADVTLDPPGGANFDNITAPDVEFPNGP